MKKRMTGQRGFTIVELLAALAIASLAFAGIAVMVNTSLEDARGQQAAQYQARLAQAAAQLVQQNATALSAEATTTKPVMVKLQGAPYQLSTYLPDGVQNENAYGQTPCLLVYATSNGGLQGLLVTEGGRTIPDAQLGYIAANAGPGGGSIPATQNAGGAALGAYGAWRFAAPNPANVSCSGTKTGVGHLVSEIFPDNSQGQNADFLYRVSVPGNPTANTMQVPIVLAQQTDFSPCTAAAGSLAADASSNLLTCSGGQWQPQASLHWRDPVASASDLGDTAKMPRPHLGDVAMTTNTGRAYTFNGTAWQALAVDEAGNLNLGNQQAQGNSCALNAADTTPVTTDRTGRVLSCQNGIWQTQSEITPGSNMTECQMMMMTPNATDYAGCAAPPSNNYSVAPFSHDTSNGTYSYTRKLTVQLTKPGIVSVTSWAHMNDGLCSTRSGAQAQMSQDVDIFTAAGQPIGHVEAQSPKLTDDSGGINNSITQAAPAGSYQVQVTTNWATYNLISTPWTSSFCGEQGQTIPNTPVAAGWTVNTYY